MLMKMKRKIFVDMLPPQSKIQTYKQAVESLEDIKIFLEHHGHLLK